MLALILGGTGWSHAATRFVHRGIDPSALGAPLAVATAAPFDDAPGILSDGHDYFYRVVDGAGQAVRISVHKQPVLDTIRLGFDDADPGSAAVDPGLSSVALSPAAVPADGTTWAVATVIPRDAGGLLLGSGLAVGVDAWALWPGSVLGPVSDLGDGSYQARLASATPGSAVVRFVVEGVTLAAEPSLEFLPVAGQTLKEQAVQQLDALTAAGGAFDSLVDGLDPGTSPADKILDAQADTLDALARLRSGDPDEDKLALADSLKSALDRLEDVIQNAAPLDSGDVEVLVDWVLDAARLVALYWLEQAEAACGSCGQGGSQHVCKAVGELASGDTRRAAADPDYDNAAQDYGKSVEESIKALDHCP
jgi:hypothetical protein